ncbi:hypothetical protein IWX65_003098 [Arthrobacter sp. CAN_A214]
MLDLRRELQTEGRLEWIGSGRNVIAFRRPGGWVSVTYFRSSRTNFLRDGCSCGQGVTLAGPLGFLKVQVGNRVCRFEDVAARSGDDGWTTTEFSRPAKSG